ncbi:hypothetical protein KGF57_004508 [Candida theae]|uniref:RxLR effector protein n=1 Tax=Candida theae TaxID=1198502 RepID=A0AAD5BB94_9ASCO|nr:uncharacterized protein KGF57_004508 [Candida theae]KAI5949998.1 hypothetical protein KGF57_004508 [Candida theae]
MHSTLFFLLPLVVSTIIPANLDLKASTVGAGTQAKETKRNSEVQLNGAKTVYNKREFKSAVLGERTKVARDSISANDLV